MFVVRGFRFVLAWDSKLRYVFVSISFRFVSFRFVRGESIEITSISVWLHVLPFARERFCAVQFRSILLNLICYFFAFSV